ncbi:MAG TPA: hypothetical protein VHR45_18490 [Thermoanaerobaculia bacterium]|nr:hypothetical protein [Thermoanaerobaculia bacterium]
MRLNLRCAAWAIAFLALASCALASWKNEPPKQRPPRAVASRKDFPATDSTLSLLEPQGAQCIWAKLDAVSKKRLAISTFDGDCRGGKIALSADRERGAVWFDPSVAVLEEHAPPGTMPRLFEVDLANGTATPVPLPSGMRDLGFDPKGRMIALTLQEPTEAETDKGEVLVDGTPVKLEPASGGDRVLVHAFAFEDGAWKRFETASSTVGSDYAPGVRELTAALSARPKCSRRLFREISSSTRRCLRGWPNSLRRRTRWKAVTGGFGSARATRGSCSGRSVPSLRTRPAWPPS